MKIRTQFILSILLFGILIVAISASVIITAQKVTGITNQEMVVNNVTQEANDLSYLANNYMIFQESQQLSTWQTEFTSFSNNVAKLQWSTPQAKSIVSNIQADVPQLKDVFESVVSDIGNPSLNQDGTITNTIFQISWSRMAVQNQELLSNASNLSQLLETQANQARRTNIIVIIALIAIFAVYFLLNYLMIERRTFKSITKLKAGTIAIGAGNLDYKIEEKSNSEIGDLSRAFNQMTADLKNVTTSKAELEKEIEDRKQSEEKLKESEERFSKAFHLSPVGVVITSLPEGRFVDVNDSFLRLIESSRQEVIGRTSAELNIYPNPNDRAQVWQLLFEKGKFENYEMTWQTRNGKAITVSSSSEEIILNGRDHALFIIVDITERKKAEEELRHRTTELEASNKELEAFSYSVSHDLRAPLRSMAGFSSALLEDYSEKLDEDGKEYLRKIEASSELMGQLMDDLLKLSRVTRSELKSEKVNLSDMAQSVVDELQKVEPMRKVKVAIASDMIAYGDCNLLRLVLDNLLGNAWKYSSKTAEPRIEMGITELNGKQSYFVRDNGVGFDMAYVNKLFQPFQRLHVASEFAGTGIGLATVQRIIRRHGGDVRAESKVGQGATFYFTLS